MVLLLLHPLPLDGSIYSDDLRGLSDVCLAPTLYEAGDDIVAWDRGALDVVGTDPVVVVGNSIGGACAIEMARLAPRQVKALVLCGVKPGHHPEPALRDEALQSLSRTGGLRAAWERYWLPLFGPAASPEVVERGRLAALERDPDAPSRLGFGRSMAGRTRKRSSLRGRGRCGSSTENTTSFRLA